MEEYFYSILIGVISSLVATAFFVMLSELVRKVLIPWYADQVYKGVRVDGRWKGVTVGGKVVPDNISVSMELKQKGDVVTGVYSHSDKEGFIETYKVNGVVRNMYVIATATPTSNKSVDGLAFMFGVDNDRNDLVLQGAVLCRGHGHGVSVHEEFKFVQGRGKTDR